MGSCNISLLLCQYYDKVSGLTHYPSFLPISGGIFHLTAASFSPSTSAPAQMAKLVLVSLFINYRVSAIDGCWLLDISFPLKDSFSRPPPVLARGPLGIHVWRVFLESCLILKGSSCWKADIAGLRVSDPVSTWPLTPSIGSFSQSAGDGFSLLLH